MLSREAYHRKRKRERRGGEKEEAGGRDCIFIRWGGGPAWNASDRALITSGGHSFYRRISHFRSFEPELSVCSRDRHRRERGTKRERERERERERLQRVGRIAACVTSAVGMWKKLSNNGGAVANPKNCTRPSYQRRGERGGKMADRPEGALQSTGGLGARVGVRLSPFLSLSLSLSNSIFFVTKESRKRREGRKGVSKRKLRFRGGIGKEGIGI